MNVNALVKIFRWYKETIMFLIFFINLKQKYFQDVSRVNICIWIVKRDDLRGVQFWKRNGHTKLVVFEIKMMTKGIYAEFNISV